MLREECGYQMKLPETLQDYFDIAWNHAVVEKQPPSARPYGSCLYRGPNGTRCFIGAAIPDEKYHPILEGHFAIDVLRDIDMIAPPGVNALQIVHDKRATLVHIGPTYAQAYRDSIEGDLRKFADEYDLRIPGEYR